MMPRSEKLIVTCTIIVAIAAIGIRVDLETIRSMFLGTVFLLAAASIVVEAIAVGLAWGTRFGIAHFFLAIAGLDKPSLTDKRRGSC